MSSLPSGTVTFLFTDIEGSTKLAQQYPEAWKTAQARHHAILREVIEANDGYVFQIIGDAFCAAFHTAAAALYAALHAQQRVCAEDWNEAPIKVRIGIHTGKAELQDNGDYSGYLTLSRVQRLMSAGHGEQTLISLATQELVRDELPGNVSLHDMGEHRLKDLTHPERIFQVNAPNLPSSFPALKTLDAQLNNLPTQLTPFVGREREIAAVLGLLRNPHVHLVTLTGPGGTGKTRLSLQIAAELLDEFEHGVWFVELASIIDPELVLRTIAATLNVKESAETNLAQALHNHLHNRQLLLVLDNFEQVVSAAPKISQLLNAAPKIKIMISSREVLRLRGEHDYPVPPLGLPEGNRHQTAAVLAQYEAIALFVQHAQAANPAFVLDEDNASLVADICTRLDGLPLALELAAARSRLLKPAAMLEKLKNKLDVLTSGARDLPRRQQTIRGAIDWSYDLLDEAEKVLFARLGIFVGGWTLEAAEAVCGEGLNVDILNGLESLLDKSLIRQTEARSGETRFTMLETIREYATEKLSRSAELYPTQQSLANYLADFLEKVIAAKSTPQEQSWFSKLDLEFDNLRSAMEWTFSQNLPLLVFKIGKLHSYWFQRSNHHEPLDWLKRAFASQITGSPLELAWAYCRAGKLSFDVGNGSEARQYFESALTIFQEIKDSVGITDCLNSIGLLEMNEKNFEKAREMYERSLASAPQETYETAIALQNLGHLARIRTDYQTAINHFLRAREICVRLRAETGISLMDFSIAGLAFVQGKFDEAVTQFQKGLQAAWLRTNPLISGLLHGYVGYAYFITGEKTQAEQLITTSLVCIRELVSRNVKTSYYPICYMLEGKALLELEGGKLQRAAQLFGAGSDRREKEIWPFSEAERRNYEVWINALRTTLGDETFNQYFEKGRAMTLKEAVDFALEEDS